MAKDEFPFKILIVGSGELPIIEKMLRKRIARPGLSLAEDIEQARKALSEESFDAVLFLKMAGSEDFADAETLIKNAGACPVIILCKEANAAVAGAYDVIPIRRLDSWLLYKTIAHAAEKKKMQGLLRDSHQRYSDLFHLNPLPMWAYHVDTLRFLSVNDAAVREYGYSRNDYKQMTILDIRPEEDIAQLEKAVDFVKKHEKLFSTGIFRHRKKNGEVISVEILSNIIYIGGEKYELVMANNITERVNHIAAIEKRNRQLREIAFEQSHIVRAPLANMLCILHVAREMDMSTDEGRELLERLFECGTQLDSSIAEIVQKTFNADGTP